MEITLEQIVEAIGKNPSLIDGILVPVLDSEKGKQAVTNRVNGQIADKVSEVHTRYDNDVFEILGTRPGTKEGGGKMKTYEFIRENLTELKGYREKKDAITKDAEVIALKAENDRLKNEGGGKHVQEIFDQAKAQWQQKETALNGEINTLKESATKGKALTSILAATAKLNFSPDVSDPIKKMVLKNVEDSLSGSAKVDETGNVTFYGQDGKPLVNPTTHAPMTAEEAVNTFEAITSIVVKNNPPGGGAPPTLKGGIKTSKVEGKDVKKLELAADSFKSKAEFIKVSEEALTAAGITRRNPEWDALKNEAYKEYEVGKLPVQ